jgi:hypothetical protein
LASWAKVDPATTGETVSWLRAADQFITPEGLLVPYGRYGTDLPICPYRPSAFPKNCARRGVRIALDERSRH